MQAVIKIVCLAGGSRTEHSNRYVESYEPQSLDRHGLYRDDGHLRTTAGIAKAKRYPDAFEAMEEWRREKGYRPDGRPNRPLTQFTIEIERVPQ